MSSVAKRLGHNYHTLRQWVEAAWTGSADSTVPADLPLQQHLRELEKENARLRRDRDILKNAAAYFVAPEGGSTPEFRRHPLSPLRL